MVDPKLLCNKHLNGEHSELHKHKPSFIKKHSIGGRIYPVVQIELSSYKNRHDNLAAEIDRRAILRTGRPSHKSPLTNLPDFSYLPKEQFEAKVDINKSLEDLKIRCPECKIRIENYELKNLERRILSR